MTITKLPRRRRYWLITKGRARNRWRRWRHRGAPDPWATDPRVYAHQLQEWCRVRRLPCAWCGRGRR